MSPMLGRADANQPIQPVSRFTAGDWTTWLPAVEERIGLFMYRVFTWTRDSLCCCCREGCDRSCRCCFPQRFQKNHGRGYKSHHPYARISKNPLPKPPRENEVVLFSPEGNPQDFPQETVMMWIGKEQKEHKQGTFGGKLMAHLKQFGGNQWKEVKTDAILKPRKYRGKAGMVPGKYKIDLVDFEQQMMRNFEEEEKDRLAALELKVKGKKEVRHLRLASGQSEKDMRGMNLDDKMLLYAFRTSRAQNEDFRKQIATDLGGAKVKGPDDEETALAVEDLLENAQKCERAYDLGVIVQVYRQATNTVYIEAQNQNQEDGEEAAAVRAMQRGRRGSMGQPLHQTPQLPEGPERPAEDKGLRRYPKVYITAFIEEYLEMAYRLTAEIKLHRTSYVSTARLHLQYLDRLQKARRTERMEVESRLRRQEEGGISASKAQTQGGNSKRRGELIVTVRNLQVNESPSLWGSVNSGGTLWVEVSFQNQIAATRVQELIVSEALQFNETFVFEASTDVSKDCEISIEVLCQPHRHFGRDLVEQGETKVCLGRYKRPLEQYADQKMKDERLKDEVIKTKPTIDISVKWLHHPNVLLQRQSKSSEKSMAYELRLFQSKKRFLCQMMKPLALAHADTYQDRIANFISTMMKCCCSRNQLLISYWASGILFFLAAISCCDRTDFLNLMIGGVGMYHNVEPRRRWTAESFNIILLLLLASLFLDFFWLVQAGFYFQSVSNSTQKYLRVISLVASGIEFLVKLPIGAFYWKCRADFIAMLELDRYLGANAKDTLKAYGMHERLEQVYNDPGMGGKSNNNNNQGGAPFATAIV